MTDRKGGTTIQDMREHVYEVVSDAGGKSKVLATFWWDGKKVQCDDEHYLEYADERSPNNMNKSDGVDFLKALPYAFKNGYVSCRRKND